MQQEINVRYKGNGKVGNFHDSTIAWGKDENVDRKHVHIFLVLLKHNIIILVLCLKTCNCALHGRVTLTLSH